jgi:hypothetical protein
MGSNRAFNIAEKIFTMLSDLRIDPEQIGTYFGRIAPKPIYDRFDLMVQGAERERTTREIAEGAQKNVYRFFNKV